MNNFFPKKNSGGFNVQIYLAFWIAAANAAVYQTPPGTGPRTGIRKIYSGQMLDTSDAVWGYDCWYPLCDDPFCRSCRRDVFG